MTASPAIASAAVRCRRTPVPYPVPTAGSLSGSDDTGPATPVGRLRAAMSAGERCAPLPARRRVTPLIVASLATWLLALIALMTVPAAAQGDPSSTTTTTSPTTPAAREGPPAAPSGP